MRSLSTTDRILRCADYIVERGATVREAAAHFGVGKTTVHTDVTKRLLKLDENRYRAVAAILRIHLNTRHLKGGEKTKEKFAKARAEQEK